MKVTELAPHFFLAAVVILLACRAVSWAVSRVGQPPVVGEMIAGVLLGPSLFGLVLPGVAGQVFPDALLPVLYVTGQIGLVAFMFQAGYEFRSHAGRGLAGTALAVSAAGVTAPTVLGIGLAVVAHGHVGIFEPGVSLGVSAAFVGVTLAITAFPMLARIITENGLAGTRFGSLSLASGATDDVTAWLMLAGVLSAAQGRARPVVVAVGGAVLFGAVVLLVGRRLLRWAVNRDWGDENRMLVTVLVLFAGAWFTDEIQLYAVFGAFCVGMAMPRGAASERVVETIGTVPRILLLPMFFTYSGLQTRFDLFGNLPLMLFAWAAVGCAVLGKFGGCWAAARLRGELPSVAGRVGALMNARGLMQLIALNIGLDEKIITSELFSALVLVALVTTVMATPVLNWLDRRDARRLSAEVPDAPDDAVDPVSP